MRSEAASTRQFDDARVPGSDEIDKDRQDAEMTWDVTHARAAIVGLALVMGGFWGPLVLVYSLQPFGR